MTSSESDFDEMTLTQRELEWHADRHQGYFGRNPKDTINELKSNRFAIGFVSGVYPGGKKVGPNGEKAMADQYAIFYKRGTYTIHQTPCFWQNNIPQGFSCGVGAKPDERCGPGNDIFVPVDCNELVLKVAKKMCDCNEDGESIRDADCFDGVRWQSGFGCIPKWINYPSEDLPNSPKPNIPKLTTPNPTEYRDNGGLILNWNDDDPWGDE